jgi:hypothetical protein
MVLWQRSQCILGRGDVAKQCRYASSYAYFFGESKSLMSAHRVYKEACHLLPWHIASFRLHVQVLKGVTASRGTHSQTSHRTTREDHRSPASYAAKQAKNLVMCWPMMAPQPPRRSPACSAGPGDLYTPEAQGPSSSLRRRAEISCVRLRQELGACHRVPWCRSP